LGSSIISCVLESHCPNGMESTARGVVSVADAELLVDDVATDEAAGAGSQLGHGK
jgi:hypothetical protein